MFDDRHEPPLIGLHLRREFGEGEMRSVALDDVSIESGPARWRL